MKMDQSDSRLQCRISCGADHVVDNVWPYLLPPNFERSYIMFSDNSEDDDDNDDNDDNDDYDSYDDDNVDDDNVDDQSILKISTV